MPNYNKAEFLEESINSVISQEYKNWNLVVIDNASKDNSKKILKKFENIADNIKIIYLSRNKGVGFSRNLGMRVSTSEYISFIDSDDYWSANKLVDQIDFMLKDNYLFTYTNYTPFITKNNKKIFKKIVIPAKSFSYEKFLDDTSIATSTMLIRKSSINTIKFPRIKNFEDYSFKCNLLREVDIAVKLEKNSMFYRITKNSLSSNKIKSFYWLWYINMKFNKLSLLRNIKSLLSISINSIKKYGFK